MEDNSVYKENRKEVKGKKKIIIPILQLKKIQHNKDKETNCCGNLSIYLFRFTCHLGIVLPAGYSHHLQIVTFPSPSTFYLLLHTDALHQKSRLSVVKGHQSPHCPHF